MSVVRSALSGVTHFEGKAKQQGTGADPLSSLLFPPKTGQKVAVGQIISVLAFPPNLKYINPIKVRKIPRAEFDPVNQINFGVEFQISLQFRSGSHRITSRG